MRLDYSKILFNFNNKIKHNELSLNINFLLLLGIGMSIGGLIWGSICIFYNLYFQSIFPFSYVIFSLINYIIFKATNNLNLSSLIQSVLSLFLPFIFQFSLGGIHNSGFIMIWASLSLIASITYLNNKNIRITLLLFLILTVISFVYDNNFSSFYSDKSANLKSFVTLNFALVSLLIFYLVYFIVKKYRDANSKLKKERKKEKVILNKIKEQQNELNNSIEYANLIQKNLLLESIDNLNNSFNHFIFFKPKSKVGGDFFWCHNIDSNKTIFLLGDCTGHGIPGAFLSMITITLLNQLVIQENEIDPSTVLNKLNSGLIKNFGKYNFMNSLKDSLDCAVCLFDKKNKKVIFSGAKSSIIISSKSSNEIKEYKGDKYNIGEREGIIFTEIEFDYLNEDLFYFFSDGYYDQFGGNNNKKFTKNAFKHLIKNISNYSMDDQKYMIAKNFNDWIGSNEQTDDVIVIGLKV